MLREGSQPLTPYTHIHAHTQSVFAAYLVNSSFAMMGALRRARPTAAERAGRVPRGALHAAVQGSRARRSTARELSIVSGEGACRPRKVFATQPLQKVCRVVKRGSFRGEALPLSGA